MRNKKGGVYLSVIIGLMIYISGVLFIPFLLDDIDTTRSDLNCSSAATLTGGEMITCLMVDLIIPHLIWIVISLALGFLLGGTDT